MLLRFAKDIDAEMGGAGERGVAACAPVDADEDERWIERDRRKGVGGKALRQALGVKGRCHGDAGREAAERLSQFCDVKRRDTGCADFSMLHYGLSADGKLTSQIALHSGGSDYMSRSEE